MSRRTDRTVSFDDIGDVRVDIMRPDTSVQCHTRLPLAASAGTVPLTAGFIADPGVDIASREVMVHAIFDGRPWPGRAR